MCDMESLNSLAEVQSRDPQLRTQARERQKKEDEQGTEMRKRAMEAMEKSRKEDVPEGNKRKKRTLDTSLNIFEEQARVLGAKVREVEEEGATRHEELIQEIRKSTAAVHGLCQLLRVLIEQRKV